MPDECGHFMIFPPPNGVFGTPERETVVEARNIQSTQRITTGQAQGTSMAQPPKRTTGTLNTKEPKLEKLQRGTMDPEIQNVNRDIETRRFRYNSYFTCLLEFFGLILSLLLCGLLIVDMIKRPRVYFSVGSVSSNTSSENLSTLTDFSNHNAVVEFVNFTLSVLEMV